MLINAYNQPFCIKKVGSEFIANKLTTQEELLQFFKPELMKSPNYFNEVAAMLARENNFTKLDNGNYLILGAY